MTAKPSLTSKTLRNMFLQVKLELEKKHQYLDAINVFPVPDGDTGVNLLSTMTRVATELEAKPKNLEWKDCLKTIAKGAFKGAKGNSGVITSQFIIGCCRHLQTKSETEVTLQDFATALQKGYEKAYKAVLNPKEGTILTVIRDTATHAQTLAESTRDWLEYLESLINIAQESTNKTTQQMEVLKEAGVVDAGAQGFVYILTAWKKAIAKTAGITTQEEPTESIQEYVKQIHYVNKDITYRFCSEFMLQDTETLPAELQAYLQPKGDSLLVIKDASEEKHKRTSIKIHIHTNDPMEVLNYLNEKGKVTHIKIDDMKYQAIQREQVLGLTKPIQQPSRTKEY